MTEAFAHLIRHLLENEPDAALRILESLTAGTIIATAAKATAVKVTTQVTTVLGRPDIEISTLDTLVYVESKVESELGDRQLERYLEELAKAEVRSKVLVLLSRYPIQIHSSLVHAVKLRRWYQVADWLLGELQGQSIRSSVSRYLVEQFVGFLEVRGITMEAVGWEMVAGVRSFRALITMLSEALSASNAPKIAKDPSCWDSCGYYFDDKKFWIGVSYDRPDTLTFMTQKIKIAANAVELAGSGRLQQETDPYFPSGRKWIIELSLNSEEVHFFARSRASQMLCIEQFLANSIACAQKILVDQGQ
ncbi:PD-(D/E)XK nuclease family protein [Singulisphaera sp. GP187]|uniref:PD-(D/E)XK nuclease family protein n=1 Tax=Singulisphaera sp. GP187 TaxID=1882752 RepID=UPI00135668C7|nr:PD-(D/E)XK nuclease family protein [Singulisphaera sp. GP187]